MSLLNALTARVSILTAAATSIIANPTLATDFPLSLLRTPSIAYIITTTAPRPAKRSSIFILPRLFTAIANTLIARASEIIVPAPFITLVSILLSNTAWSVSALIRIIVAPIPFMSEAKSKDPNLATALARILIPTANAIMQDAPCIILVSILERSIA